MKKILLYTLLSFLGIAMAQTEANDPWKRTLQAISDHKILKATIANGNLVKELEKSEYTQLLKESAGFKVLTEPSCRCLPTVTANVVFFLSDANVMIIQVTKEHWFQAVFFYRGRILQFMLIAENNKFYNTVENILHPPQKNARCDECADKMYIMMIGKCQDCRGTTASAAFKLCDTCALKKDVCQVCGKSLSSKTEPAEKVMTPPPQNTKCEECEGMMYMMSIGSCTVCGATTSSGAFKLCDACALNKRVCQVCGKKLP